jgi:hypothetical protein
LSVDHRRRTIILKRGIVQRVPKLLLYNKPTNPMNVILKRINSILHSRRFFWAVLAFFIIEASWIALSAVYPQAFDEDFHFGIIKIYSHYWLPFLGSQPPNSDVYGAVPRDPSYLYHYAMSFPYRLIALFAHGQTAQIILLRFINIAFAAAGLVLFRRVLLRARVSPILTNLSLLLFVLIPIVPQVAGQVNYDNLLFPLVAGACLLAMEVHDELRGHQPSARTLITLLSVCVFASLVKYEFFPIFVGIGIFLLYIAYSQYHGAYSRLLGQFWKSWRALSRHTRVILAVTLLMGIGLFLQRDGVNLIKYHALEPNCSKVLSVQSCKSYGPWGSSYERHNDLLAYKGTVHFYNPLEYTGWWLYWIWYRSFFAINGPSGSFQNYPPLPLPAAAAILITISGLVVLGVRRRRMFTDNPYLTLLAVVVLVYLAALWLSGYMQYRYTNYLVLMNGRYILPIILLIAAIIGRPLALLLRDRNRLKVSAAAIVLIMFLQGGGVLTFITRSDSNWDWPNSSAISVNDTARKVLKPVILEGRKTYDTNVWVFN